MIDKVATMALAVTMLAATPAMAKQSAPSSAAPKVYGSDRHFDAWNLHCETRTDITPAVRICGLMSTVTLKNEAGASAVALKLMLRSVPGEPGRQLSADVPISAWLPEGVRLIHAGKELVRLPFVACRPDSCQAGAVLRQEQLAALGAITDQADASYQLQTRKTVTLTFSMRGFADGAAALEKSLSQGS